MIEDIKDIKKLRKSLGLTQKELANYANVSQSLITKIESGQLDPSFSNAKKIINTLENYKKKNEILAKNVMSKPVAFVKPLDSTKKIIKIFKQKNYSQIPVEEENLIIGLITEKELLNSLSSSKIFATDIMLDAPPFINPNTTLEPIISLLKHFPCVLVAEKGKVKGIITKSDIITLKL